MSPFNYDLLITPIESVLVIYFIDESNKFATRHSK